MCALSALLDLFFTCRFTTKEQIMRGCHSCCGNATQVQASFRHISVSLPDVAWQTTAIITAARHLLIHTHRPNIAARNSVSGCCCKVVKGKVHLNSHWLPFTFIVWMKAAKHLLCAKSERKMIQFLNSPKVSKFFGFIGDHFTWLSSFADDS